jgi:Ca2+-binding RTX toxin-like protein
MNDIIKVDNLTTNNQIFGKDGNDYIKGGPKFGLIFGGRGDDRIQSDSGRADVTGDDEVSGEDGDDSINGQAGDDILNGGNGDDDLLGDGGDDMLIAGNGNDHLYGGIGDDVLQGGSGSDYFNCGAGLDVVIDYNPKQNDLVTVDCDIHLLKPFHSSDSAASSSSLIYRSALHSQMRSEYVYKVNG